MTISKFYSKSWKFEGNPIKSLCNYSDAFDAMLGVCILRTPDNCLDYSDMIQQMNLEDEGRLSLPMRYSRPRLTSLDECNLYDGTVITTAHRF